MDQIKVFNKDILNLNDKKIQTLSHELKNRFGQVKAIYISDKNQNKILEYYRRDFLTENYVQITGATDGIVSLLVGAAIKDNIFPDEKILVKDLLPEKVLPEIAGKDDIRLDHFLTMTSGLDWPPPITGFSPQNEDIRILNEIRQELKPGEKFVYKPDSHIVMCLLEEITGQSISEVTEKYLFGKLKIEDYLWELCYKGYQGLYIKIPDLSKIMTLVLNKGKWEGEQLLDENYLERALSFKVEGSFPETNNFGYFWWLLESGGMKIQYASGYGGQYLFVIPELGISIIIISEVERPHPVNKELVIKYILGNN